MNNKTIPSSTGGTITFTATGLKHTAGKNYNSAHAPEDTKEVIKKGRRID